MLDLLVRHREKLRRLDPDTEETRTLQFLVEARRKFVNDKTRYANRLTAYLKMYFPQVLVWFGEVSSQIVGDFRAVWRTLDRLQRVIQYSGPFAINREVAEYWVARSSLVKPGDDDGAQRFSRAIAMPSRAS